MVSGGIRSGLFLGLSLAFLSVSGAFAQSKPVFSATRGFRSTPFNLSFDAVPAGVTIYYTLDGSLPSSSPLARAYTGPINIATTRVVRAYRSDCPALLAPTAPVSNCTETHSYIFPSSVVQQPLQPTRVGDSYAYPRHVYSVGNNGSAQHDYAMDPAITNQPAYQADLASGLQEIPTISIAVDSANLDTDMFSAAGFYDAPEELDIEKPISFEILSSTQPTLNLQQNAGVENHSHNRLKRSLRINFKTKFGSDSITSGLFQEAPLNGTSASSKIVQIVLRSGNNRSWARNWNPDVTTYTEDQWYRDSQIAVSCFGAHGNFAHLYINGLYWGLYNPTERPIESWQPLYFAENPSLTNKNDYFSLKSDGRPRGDGTRWITLIRDLAFRDQSIPANYAEIQQYLDVESFIDYLLVSWYQAQTDWPENNWFVGYRNTKVVGGVTYSATPLRYFAWDGEWSWNRGATYGVPFPLAGAWVHPSFRANYGDSYDPLTANFNLEAPEYLTVNVLTMPVLFRALRANPDFMTLLGDRAYRHLFQDGELTEARALSRWNTLNAYIQNAIVAESARWGDALAGLQQPTRTRNTDWQNGVTAITNLMTNNVARMVTALRGEGYYPTIDPPAFSLPGGLISSPTALSMTNPNATGAIVYTLETVSQPVTCSDRPFTLDPRASGGALSGSAQSYSGAITIPVPTAGTKRVVRARVKSGSLWSPVATLLFVGPAATPTPTPTNTPTPTPTPSPSPTATPTQTPTATLTPTPTATPSLTPTPSPTETPTPTPSETPTPTLTSTPSPTATVTPPSTPLPTPTSSPEPTLAPDVEAPKVTVLDARGSRRSLELRFQIEDASGEAHTRISIYRHGRRVARIEPSTPVAALGALNVQPVARRLAKGRYRYCVSATDSAGNQSHRSCAKLVVS